MSPLLQASSSRPRLSRASITPMRRRYGRSGSQDKESLSLMLIPVNAGPIMRSSRITVGGTDKMPITIITGTTPFIIALVMFAETIRLSRATTRLMGRIPPGPWSVMTARVTRSGWHPAQSGSVAATWTQTLGHRLGISSACNGSLLRRGSMATIPTPPRRRTLQTTPGSARLRKDVRPTRCKLLSKHKPLLVS